MANTQTNTTNQVSKHIEVILLTKQLFDEYGIIQYTRYQSFFDSMVDIFEDNGNKMTPEIKQKLRDQRDISRAENEV